MDRRVILLVEDNPDDVMLTLRVLKKNHILNPVVVARDGVEALDYLFGLEAHVGRDVSLLPAVMLLDLKLPRIDGLEVLRRVRGDPRTQLLRVVVLTSSHEEQDIVQSYKLGANSYIRKPVSFHEFRDAARQLGVYWLVMNQGAPPRD